jgi:hypothetical protein
VSRGQQCCVLARLCHPPTASATWQGGVQRGCVKWNVFRTPPAAQVVRCRRPLATAVSSLQRAPAEHARPGDFESTAKGVAHGLVGCTLGMSSTTTVGIRGVFLLWRKHACTGWAPGHGDRQVHWAPRSGGVDTGHPRPRPPHLQAFTICSASDYSRFCMVMTPAPAAIALQQYKARVLHPIPLQFHPCNAAEAAVQGKCCHTLISRGLDGPFLAR